MESPGHEAFLQLLTTYATSYLPPTTASQQSTTHRASFIKDPSRTSSHATSQKVITHAAFPNRNFGSHSPSPAGRKPDTVKNTSRIRTEQTTLRVSKREKTNDLSNTKRQLMLRAEWRLPKSNSNPNCNDSQLALMTPTKDER